MRHYAFLKKIPSIQLDSMAPLNHEPFSSSHREFGQNIPLDLQGEDEDKLFAVTYGEYLLAVKRFLLGHWDLFLDALSNRMACPVAKIDELFIMAAKHGSDYHPARLVGRVGDSQASFVVNVALNSRGRNRLEREFFLLKALRSKHERRYLPDVYFLGEETIHPTSGPEIESGMFLGEWFTGFHEFHLSRTDRSDSLHMVLWDEDCGYCRLSKNETMELYRQASFILTYYYDTETFSEIFPWHHAAGDFVATRPQEKTEVKLITVRQYAPRTAFEEKDQENRLQALVLFLANLTIRMRLDRLDGTGETVWAPDYSLAPVVNGFFEGLLANSSVGGDPAQMREDLVFLLKKMAPGNLAELFSIVADAYHTDAPDFPVISEHLADHCLEFYKFVATLPDVRI